MKPCNHNHTTQGTTLKIIELIREATKLPFTGSVFLRVMIDGKSFEMEAVGVGTLRTRRTMNLEIIGTCSTPPKPKRRVMTRGLLSIADVKSVCKAVDGMNKWERNRYIRGILRSYPGRIRRSLRVRILRYFHRWIQMNKSDQAFRDGRLQTSGIKALQILVASGGVQ